MDYKKKYAEELIQKQNAKKRRSDVYENLVPNKNREAIIECCRESAQNRIRDIIERKKVELSSLETLLKVAEKEEIGSDLEVVIWKLLCGELR